VNWLVAASVATRDARILSTVLDAASNTTLPSPTRVSALRVLVTYGDSAVWVGTADLRERRALVLPAWDHPSGKDGDVHFPAGVRQTVLQHLQALATSDPDTTVRNAAEFIVRAFPRP